MDFVEVDRLYPHDEPALKLAYIPTPDIEKGPRSPVTAAEWPDGVFVYLRYSGYHLIAYYEGRQEANAGRIWKKHIVTIHRVPCPKTHDPHKRYIWLMRYIHINARMCVAPQELLRDAANGVVTHSFFML